MLAIYSITVLLVTHNLLFTVCNSLLAVFCTTCSLQYNSAMSVLHFAANSELQTQAFKELLSELKVAQHTNNSERKLALNMAN